MDVTKLLMRNYKKELKYETIYIDEEIMDSDFDMKTNGLSSRISISKS